MKKIFIVAATCVLASALLVGCGSTTEATKAQSVAKNAPLDWQGREFGKEIPDWVSSVAENEIRDLEKLPDAKSKKLICVTGQGQDRDLIAIDADTRSAYAALSASIRSSVFSSLKAGMQGSKERDENVKAAEQLAQNVSSAEFSGFEKLRSFWTLVDTANGGTEYHYYALFGIESESLKKQIVESAKKNPSTTPEEAALLEKIDDAAEKAAAGAYIHNAGTVGR